MAAHASGAGNDEAEAAFVRQLDMVEEMLELRRNIGSLFRDVRSVAQASAIFSNS